MVRKGAVFGDARHEQTAQARYAAHPGKASCRSGSAVPDIPAARSQQNLCENCGALISAESRRCLTCAREAARTQCAEMREARRSAQALKKRSESATRWRGQQLNWSPSEHPSWLTDELYLTSIQPLLKALPRKATASALGVTTTYIRMIISGKHIPHKRHWGKLAELVGVSPGE
jgi:hypothetical protein